MGNIYAVNVARYTRYPEVKTKGLAVLQKQLALFTSEKVIRQNQKNVHLRISIHCHL